ncbi:MAG: hypothetical protein S4CHLAM102_15320 [Chlamydiia bacterium]|nr:hypothetical protein [Chlamydiia bacterium]
MTPSGVSTHTTGGGHAAKCSEKAKLVLGRFLLAENLTCGENHIRIEIIPRIPH